MFQIDNATAAATKPASTPPGSAGYFTDGSPATNQPATIVPAEWLNSIMMELINVLTSAGVTPDKAKFNQLATAIGNTVQASGPIVGHSRNVTMNVSATQPLATLTADEIVVGTALGGKKYLLSNFNHTLNPLTTGPNGMDTGAPPNSGWIAFYAIYNPTTNTHALLGVNATTVAAPQVYAGANMPAGFTASALVSVWPTTPTGTIAGGLQRDRTVALGPNLVLNSTVNQPQVISLSIGTVVPPNTKRISGSMMVGSSATAAMTINVSGGPGRVGEQGITLAITAGIGGAFAKIDLVAPQALWYLANIAAGTPTIQIYVSAYEF